MRESTTQGKSRDPVLSYWTKLPRTFVQVFPLAITVVCARHRCQRPFENPGDTPARGCLAHPAAFHQHFDRLASPVSARAMRRPSPRCGVDQFYETPVD